MQKRIQMVLIEFNDHKIMFFNNNPLTTWYRVITAYYQENTIKHNIVSIYTSTETYIRPEFPLRQCTYDRIQGYLDSEGHERKVKGLKFIKASEHTVNKINNILESVNRG